MATYVPGKVVTIRDPSGYTQRKWQRAHYADARGRWVSAPKKKVGGTITSSVGGGDVSSGGYHGLSDQDIINQANAYADSAIAAKTAAIERARAQARAQAEGDVQMYQGLGQAQMSMIGQIPANIQAIRDTAGKAIASFGGQVTDAQQSQATAEQAANAAFTASQTGGTAAAAPDPGGVNAAGAAAAENAMGGTIPATSQAEIGAASAIAASGMPAVVARATQDQIAQRMAQAATEDADYRQQLIDAASERGGIYMDAVQNAYDIEAKKFGVYQAQQQLEMDREKLNLQWQAELANEVQFGIKTRQQAAQELARRQEAWARIGVSQSNADLQGANYYTDAQGRLVPKGYKYNAKGALVKIATPPKPKAPKNPKGHGEGIKAANSMAASAKSKKVGRQAAINQIVRYLVSYGYPQGQAAKLADDAVSTYYGKPSAASSGGGSSYQG